MTEEQWDRDMAALEPNGQCIGCGMGTNGWFPEGGTHGPGWYCGWCEAVPA